MDAGRRRGGEGRGIRRKDRRNLRARTGGRSKLALRGRQSDASGAESVHATLLGFQSDDEMGQVGCGVSVDKSNKVFLPQN